MPPISVGRVKTCSNTITFEAACKFSFTSNDRRRADLMQRMHIKKCEVCKVSSAVTLQQKVMGPSKKLSSGKMFMEQKEYQEAVFKIAHLDV